MSLFNELKRRNVFRVGVAYAILAWLLIQIVDTVLPTFDAPRWVIQTITFVIILGFPLALFLAWAFELTPEGLKSEAAAKLEQPAAHGRENFARVKSNTLNVIIMGLLVLAVGFLLVDRYVIDRVAVANSPVAAANFQGDTIRTSLVLPDESPMIFGGSPVHSLAVSPDGKTIVYVTNDPAGSGTLRSQLALRQLNSLETRILPGTQGAAQPFFSPDGQWLAFFTVEGEIKKISLAGGQPVTILEDLNGALWSSGHWLEDGRIVFSTRGDNHTLWITSDDGGEAREITLQDSRFNEVQHGTPFALPGSDVVVFTTAYLVEGQARLKVEGVTLATGERQVILDGASARAWLDSGHLLISRDGVLLVAPFDPAALAFTGTAVPVTDEIRFDGYAGEGTIQQIAVSRSGTMAFAPRQDLSRNIYIVNPDGSTERLDIRPGNYIFIDISPDGNYAALEDYNPGIEGSRLWIYNFVRNTLIDFSGDGSDHSPQWHPDNRSLVVASGRGDQAGLWLKTLDGENRLLVATGGVGGYRNGSWHPDGKHFALTRQIGYEHDIVLMTLSDRVDGENTIEPLMTGPFAELSPRFSPDGRWLAYMSDKSGNFQVYVKGYPDGEEYVVSSGQGANAPVWGADGSTLIYSIAGQDRGPDTLFQIAVVTVSETANGVEFSRPEIMTPEEVRNSRGIREWYNAGNNAGNGYDVFPDGRFLMSRGQLAEGNEIVLVQNWFAELQDRAPVK